MGWGKKKQPPIRTALRLLGPGVFLGASGVSKNLRERYEHIPMFSRDAP